MATATIYGTKDIHLNKFQPDTNFELGSGYPVEVGWTTGKVERRALLRADLSSKIAAGSTITGADLYLHIGALNPHESSRYTGYRSLQAWVEDEATWNIYKSGTSWGEAGCHLANTDFEVSPGFGPWNPTETGWTSVDCTSFVQDAWANQGKIFDALLWNNMLPGEDESADINFGSRGSAVEWYIAVTYTPPAGGPCDLVVAAQVM